MYTHKHVLEFYVGGAMNQLGTVITKCEDASEIRWHIIYTQLLLKHIFGYPCLITYDETCMHS